MMLALALTMMGAGASDIATLRSAPAEIMILGSPHLANNNRDVANIPVPDVMTPDRQREIEAIVDTLAAWRPTRVMVEYGWTDQSELDRRYADYRAGRLAPTANERDQIALRLAARLNLSMVHAVDWSESEPGPAAAYDWFAWARANGQTGRLQRLVTQAQAEADALGRLMPCSNVAAWYRRLNDPAQIAASNAPYYDIASFGSPAEDVGAAWTGGWYARNMRIFNNIVRAAKSGDRVLVLYGAGHLYHLTTFARESGAFHLVDPLTILPAATGCE